MIKRIGLLMAAALLVATMAVAGLGGPAFAVTVDKQCKGGNPNCELTGPGNSENGPAANGGNPNIKDEFQGGKGNR